MSAITALNSYRHRGFIDSVEVLAPDAAREFAAQFDTLVEREGIDLLAPSFQLHDRHLDRDFIWSVATSPSVLDVIDALVGPNILMLGSRFIVKPPQSTLGVPWHRDADYAGLYPCSQVNVWLAVDEVDDDNGCLRVLPRVAAEHAEARAHTAADPSDANLVDQQLALADEERAALVSLPLRGGCMTVFDGNLVHGSEANVSSRRRCGLAMRYTSASTKLLNEGQWAAVCVRGTADRQGGRVISREQARTFTYRKIDKFGAQA